MSALLTRPDGPSALAFRAQRPCPGGPRGEIGHRRPRAGRIAADRGGLGQRRGRRRTALLAVARPPGLPAGGQHLLLQPRDVPVLADDRAGVVALAAVAVPPPA